MIPQRNISLISNALVTAGGKRIPESVIERDYVLAWFLNGLAGHPLREVLAFKGGTALRRCWFENYRFSEDLDFTLIVPTEFDAILIGLNEIFEKVMAESGLQITFDRKDRNSHQNSHTFYLGYEGPLPAKNSVKVDITIGELLCFPLKEKKIYRTYGYFSDLPNEATIRVYSLEEIVIEKLLALSDRARNEPRDLYDLWHLLGTTKDLNIAHLRPELEKKAEFKNREPAGIEESIAAKEKRLKNLWKQRLENQMSNLPEFDEVFREVLRAIRAANLPKAEDQRTCKKCHATPCICGNQGAKTSRPR